MSAQTLNWIIRANKFSDLYQFSPERHFDNAPNRAILCDRWKHGLHLFMKQAVDCSASLSSSSHGVTLKNRRRALSAFGAATHALADFYAHTNWVELHAVQGDVKTIAPMFGKNCSEDDFPIDLQSGYFNLWYGVRGCPKAGPPREYTYCHEQLAKDHPNKGHGADLIRSLGLTFHELAVELAIKATVRLWESLHERITERYQPLEDAKAIFLALSWGKGMSKARS